MIYHSVPPETEPACDRPGSIRPLGLSGTLFFSVARIPVISHICISGPCCVLLRVQLVLGLIFARIDYFGAYEMFCFHITLTWGAMGQFYLAHDGWAPFSLNVLGSLWLFFDKMPTLIVLRWNVSIWVVPIPPFSNFPT